MFLVVLGITQLQLGQSSLSFVLFNDTLPQVKKSSLVIADGHFQSPGIYVGMYGLTISLHHLRVRAK